MHIEVNMYTSIHLVSSYGEGEGEGGELSVFACETS
jgi:hypothetical protein